MKPLFAYLPLAAALIGTLAAPVAAKSDPWDALRAQARGRAKAGDFAGAEKLYTQAIALLPVKDGHTWTERATVFDERGEIREKLNDIDGAIQDYTTSLTALGIGSNTFIDTILAKRAKLWLKKGEPLRAMVDTLVGKDYSDRSYNCESVLGDVW